MLNISTVPKRFREGHTTQPGAYGSGTIYNGGSYAYVPCGDLDAKDVIRVVQTNAVASTPGKLVEVQAQRIHGINGQFTVETSTGANVAADTTFDWWVVKF